MSRLDARENQIFKISQEFFFSIVVFLFYIKRLVRSAAPYFKQSLKQYFFLDSPL